MSKYDDPRIQPIIDLHFHGEALTEAEEVIATEAGFKRYDGEIFYVDRIHSRAEGAGIILSKFA
mgnify:CR=1 FL=1